MGKYNKKWRQPMNIRYVSRQYIINTFLDHISMGFKLTRGQLVLLKDLSKTINTKVDHHRF